VLTYMHGCGLGMAIYERIETQTPNPTLHWRSATCSLCVNRCACSKIRR
jgi:hypothetical protein